MARKSIMVLNVVDNKRPSPEVVHRVAALTGRSVLSVVFEMFRRALSPQRLLPDHFLSYGIWRNDLTKLQKSQFIDMAVSARLNIGAMAKGLVNHTGLLTDKFLTARLLDSAGVRTPRILAAYAADASFGQVPMVRDREGLAEVLANPAHHPCFCKPNHGSRAAGTVWINSATPDGMLVLGSGRQVSALDLADEAIANFPQGWLIQEFVRPCAEIVRVTGPALASLRVVTIWTKGQEPRVLYCVWRLPGPGSENDSVSAGVNGIALVDHQTGRVVRAVWGSYVTGGEITTSPASTDQTPILGFVIPQFQEMAAQMCSVHQMLPGHGILGFDATITDDGPLVTEINARPFHNIWQPASGLPFGTPDNLALFKEAAAGVGARMGAKT